MRLYRRGRIWWIEFMRDGSQKRISTHTDSKKVATAVKNDLEAARLLSRKSISSKALISIVEAVCAEFGKSLSDLASELSSFPMTASTTNVTVSGTPLSITWNLYEDTARTCALLPGETTLYKRMNYFLRFIKWVETDMPTVETLESVTGKVAARFARSLADSGLSTKTRKNILGDLGSVWRVLSKQIDGLQNPWANLAPRDTDGKRGEAFTREEEAKVLEAAKAVGKDWLPVCLIMRHTGLRYGDVALLKWEQVDLEHMVLNITPHKTARNGISVTPAIIPAVAEAINSLPHESEYLFPLHAKWYGNRGRASREALSFREVLNAAEISRDGITVHSWRHTAASRLAEAGVDKETRKRLLGHTVDVTADRYDHTDHADENLAAQLAASK